MFKALIASCAFVLLAPACFGQIGNTASRDPEYHFQLKPAPMWSRAEQSVISAVDTSADESNPYRTSSVSMVWQRSSSPKVVYPFVYVEVTRVDLSTWNFANIEVAFDAPTRPEKAAALGKPMLQLAGELADGELVLDRQRKRIVEKHTGNDEENIPFTELTIGFLGKNSVVHIGFVGDSRQLDYYLPEFQRFVDGFQWDSGAAWNETPGGKGSDYNGWTANRSKEQIAAAESRAAASPRQSRSSSSGSYHGRYYGFGGLGAVTVVILRLMLRRALRD